MCRPADLPIILNIREGSNGRILIDGRPRKLVKNCSENEALSASRPDGLTDGRTDGHTDRQTDGRTYGRALERNLIF